MLVGTNPGDGPGVASWTLLVCAHQPQGLAGSGRAPRSKPDQRPSDGALIHLRRCFRAEEPLRSWENLQIISWGGGGAGLLNPPPQPVWTQRFWLLVGCRRDLLPFSCISFPSAGLNAPDYK